MISELFILTKTFKNENIERDKTLEFKTFQTYMATLYK